MWVSALWGLLLVAVVLLCKKVKFSRWVCAGFGIGVVITDMWIAICVIWSEICYAGIDCFVVWNKLCAVGFGFLWFFCMGFVYM